MKTFTSSLNEMKEYKKIAESKSKLIQICGCIESGQAHFVSCMANNYKNCVIVTYNEQRAKEIIEDYKCFDRNILFYPAKDFIFFQADIHGNLLVEQRQKVIKRIIENQGITVVTTIDGMMDKVMPISHIKKNIISFEVGEIIDITDIEKRMVLLGYERRSQVEATGEFAIRGNIIDIFPLTEEVPVRIDLWDDEIDSIKLFDVESQRSIENLDEITIYPAAEYLLSKDELVNGINKIKEDGKQYYDMLRNKMKTEEAHRIKRNIKEFEENVELLGANGGIDSYIKYFCENTLSFVEYFDKEDTLFVLDEPNRISQRCQAVETEIKESMINRIEKGYMLPKQAEVYMPSSEIFAAFALRNTRLLTMLDQEIKDFKVDEKFNLNQKHINSYNNSFEMLVKDLDSYKKRGYKVIILSGSEARGKRMASDIRDLGIEAYYSDDLNRELVQGEIMLTSGSIHKGFEYSDIKFAIITQNDIFGVSKNKKRKKKKYSGSQIQNFADLNIGDYVVHENHGLGIYRGLEKIEVDKVVKDYIKIEYANNGNLYILATQLDLIQKYAGSDARKPKLNKLGSKEWQNTKTRVRRAVKDMAKELVDLYAIRQAKKGFAFEKDTVWQTEFEEEFPFQETDDQLMAIEETKRDMESTKIMDRLVCGDVGFGKTEIAIRAAFKAVQSGKQVVFIVPTTILAGQHYNTFAKRMEDFPVRVDLLSRFRTPAEQKDTLKGLKSGEVDIIIGTHRVLSKDVEFKDLGLLIIDEEQRFGVAHKEKIKQLKSDIDVLTLTATPIPRTLHMSLVGIRDMSVLEEAPVDRQPIQTYVMEYDDEMIREAISREMARGGQVYYVYNRVNNIEEVALQVAKIVPNATVSFAHGQMSARKVEQIMHDFTKGDIDVLVATTIIETGLDISNVNTMIIHDADNLGLSQLYQLRGRVGRTNRTAYAFLMYRRDKLLKEIAEKRLQAIREFTELGSGFKIAMKDLEIRGAGNILGAEQHGHMEAIGYDLYCKMLNEAVMFMRGEIEETDEFETSVDMDIDAYIPSEYIKNEYQRLSVYKKIACIMNEEEFMDMQDELLDRFGDIPKAVDNLMNIALIKALAHELYITDILGGKKDFKLVMFPKAKINAEKIPELLKKYNRKVKFVTDAKPYFVYTSAEIMKDMKDIKKELMPLLTDMHCLVEREEEKVEKD